VASKARVRRRESFTMVENSVADDARVTGGDLLVFIALARYANCDTGRAWPSVETLGKVSRRSRPMVIESLRHLEELEHIEVERKAGRGSTYWIGASKVALPGSKVALPPSKVALPEQDLSTKTNQQDKASNPVAVRVFERLRTQSGRDRMRMTDNTLKPIEARLREKYTEADLNYIIDIKCTEWRDTEFAKYLQPSTLFSKSHIDNYLAQESNGEGKAQWLKDLVGGA